MTKRGYVSSVRNAAAAKKRDRVVEAAAKSLREDESIARFSLDTVAKAAGVTRLTVYNQFGSRRGLLEAVFDDIARHGGLHRLGGAPGVPEPPPAPDRGGGAFSPLWAPGPPHGPAPQAMGP